MSSNSQQKFSIKEQKCLQVVVFTDRAEVKRSIKCTLEKGENEVVLSGVSNFVDRDSIRVEGHGAATVLDVVCQTRHVEGDVVENKSERELQLKAEIKELEAKRDTSAYKIERVGKQIAVLNEFATNLAKPKNGKIESVDDSLKSSKENVDSFMVFLDTYSQKLEILDALKYELDKEIKVLKEQIDVAYSNLRKLNAHNFNEIIEVTILVDSAKDKAEVELIMSYVVYSASWIPKYDIRVFNSDKKMTINYFGLITQSTGEDWNETKLSLSTAVPAIGGNVPELSTQVVGIKQPPPPPVPKMMARSSPMRFKTMAYASACEMNSVGGAGILEMSAERMEYQTAQIQSSNIGSTSTYEIPRSATVPSDNNTHKVTIGIIELKPEFEYESVPKKSAYAFIKAKVTNTSEYSLLAGSANVFLDNNFVAKTQLKSYSPQEEFYCSLGVDPAIRIDYKPLRKFKGQSGIINKTTTTTFVQVIEVKNTTSGSVKLLVSDNLPMSNDEKINVKLIEPNIKNTSSIRLNKMNNLEFDLNLAANKKEDVTIKYTVDHPSDKEVEFY